MWSGQVYVGNKVLYNFAVLLATFERQFFHLEILTFSTGSFSIRTLLGIAIIQINILQGKICEEKNNSQ